VNHHFLIIVLAFLGSTTSAICAESAAAPVKAVSDYAQIATERAGKIVATLHLNEPARALRVQVVIARQYQSLHDIHETRDKKIAATKTLPDAANASAKVTTARDEADERIRARHAKFLAELAVELTPEQIDAVKDGMTYGVLPLTFAVYQRMLPDLTPAQKQQILAWLREARELAMDAGSSKEKHAWFGKYKGKINNYLSAAGIDMKAAEKNLTGK
jgi:Spy/CpxP family protein refolding chaperone